MKKIKNVSVSSERPFRKKYVKIFTVFLMLFLFVMLIILIRVYFSVNKKSAEKQTVPLNIITQAYKDIDDYEIFKSDEGLIGISDKNGRIILEPVWENLFILSETRFVVSKTIGGVRKMGIVDSDSNIVVPFVFTEFRSFSREFLGGFTGNNDDFFLFDNSGNLLADRIWTGCNYSDRIIFLNDGDDEYRCKFIDGKFQYIYVDLKRNVGNVPFRIRMAEAGKINSVGTDRIERISDILQGYLEYLASGYENDISGLTSEQYYSSLASNDFFENCTLKNISDFSLESSEDSSKISYSIKLIVDYDYMKDNSELYDISSEIVFNIVNDENNRLVLKSINKTEL